MSESSPVLQICENVLLAPYTTLGIGGAAHFLVKVRTEEHIWAALEFARARSCPIFVLGGGSNLVVSDSGFPGLVIKIELSGILNGENSGQFSVAAGVDWDSFVQHCVSRNLAGIECLSGIPGTVGAAPIQNIGAYGEEVSEVIARVTALDRSSHRIDELSGADCRFAYRSSIFNTTHKDRYIILKVDFGLRTDGAPCIRYEDLQKRFAHGKGSPNISDVREAVLQERHSKAMILSENDPDTKSAGSFFKNPVLDVETIAKAETEARARGVVSPRESIPRFPAPGGKEKVPAAWLIERAGFPKGHVHKGAGISSKHSLAIINRNGATARDVLDLMRLIQDRVQKVFGIALLPEPVFIGFKNEVLESGIPASNV